MITAISRQVAAIGNFSLYAFDHPHFGLNATDSNPETFSLEQCERNASNAVNHVLSLPNTERVVLIGSSLGFWSFFQILSKEAQGNRSKILALLGKSGIASYIKVLYRFLDQCGANGNYEDETAWNKLLGNYQVNRQTGWGGLTVNPGDQPVPIHENFFR